ncbi:MAG: hypothetical protein WA734_00280, partial [Candidatus Acidiferrales bacterium]
MFMTEDDLAIQDFLKLYDQLVMQVDSLIDQQRATSKSLHDNNYRIVKIQAHSQIWEYLRTNGPEAAPLIPHSV